jgi:hypothetical protein
MEAAKALLQIRELKLWQGKYASFDAYALERWKYETAHAYRLCAWAEVSRVVSPIGENPPQRESVARPLYGLKPNQQVKVWKAATRTSPTPTAAKVTEAVQKVLRSAKQQTATSEQQRGSGSVVCADAVKGLSQVENRSIDLLLTSPPYCEQRKDFPGIPEKDFPAWIVSVMEAARPKMKPAGNIIINMREHVRGGQISDYILKSRLAIRAAGWCEIDVLMWHKTDAPPLGRTDRPRRAYDCLYWYSLTPNPFVDVYA